MGPDSKPGCLGSEPCTPGDLCGCPSPIPPLTAAPCNCISSGAAEPWATSHPGTVSQVPAWRLQGLQNPSSGFHSLHWPHWSKSPEKTQELRLAAPAEQTEQPRPRQAHSASDLSLSRSPLHPNPSRLRAVRWGRRGSACLSPQPSGKRQKANLIHSSGRLVRRRRVALRETCEMSGTVPFYRRGN